MSMNRRRERIFWRGKKGARMPEGWRICNRSSRWGNPHNWGIHGREAAVQMYRRDLEAMTEEQRIELLHPLRDAEVLCCNCRLDQTCHVDVIIEYLNKMDSVLEDTQN